MVFGLQGAPGTFSRMIAVDVAPMYREFPPNRFKHYMDDCLIATADRELTLHWKMNHRLLDIFEEHSYFLKPSKCEFEKTEIDFLGVRLGNGQITIDPSKITGIKEWPRTLKSVKEVRSTLGVLGFQRPFIPRFAHIAKPLTGLLKKDSTFNWTPECTQALDRLIHIVTSEPILVPSDTERQFILEVDASQYATGAILFQADKKLKDRQGNPILRPCGYHSQTFSATEQHYPIYNREFLAIIRGLKHWDYLLKGAVHPVLIITNHANLQFHQHAHKIGPHIAGYIAEREQYDIQLVYKPGASNRADALSRRPDYAPDSYNDEPVVALPEHLFMPPNMLTIDLQAQLTKPTRIRTLSFDNPTGEINADTPNVEIDAPVWIRSIEDDNLNTDIETEVLHVQSLKKNQIQLDSWRRTHGIEHQPGDLWWKGTSLVVVGNDDLKRGVISLFHDHIAAGHPGIAKTTQNIAQYYWWPGMRDHITQYIKGCATCQMHKVNMNPTKPPLYPITPVPNELPFQTIALDFITKLPVSEGYNTILTITDHNCSKASLFIPCKETIDSEGVAQLFVQHIVPHYGTPRKIISDRDTRFTSNFTTELCRILGIKQNISTAYHPQTDGQSERTNQSLEQYLRLVCANDQKAWARWLPMAQYVKNSWPSSTTKKTPFELLLGYTPTIYQPTRTSLVPGVTD
jgi:RNase H-like domain found in reverse transcriptase/Integrase zinc binding domain/Reverse transcriptase (RNA-dependent DNA polymerase)